MSSALIGRYERISIVYICLLCLIMISVFGWTVRASILEECLAFLKSCYNEGFDDFDELLSAIKREGINRIPFAYNMII